MRQNKLPVYISNKITLGKQKDFEQAFIISGKNYFNVFKNSNKSNNYVCFI